MVDSPEPSAFENLLRNEIWLKDISALLREADTYHKNSEISSTVKQIRAYYIRTLESNYWSEVPKLAADTDGVVQFMQCLGTLGTYYTEQNDLEGNALLRQIAGAVMKALPHLKKDILEGCKPRLTPENLDNLQRFKPTTRPLSRD